SCASSISCASAAAFFFSSSAIAVASLFGITYEHLLICSCIHIKTHKLLCQYPLSKNMHKRNRPNLPILQDIPRAASCPSPVFFFCGG
ncbi:hypothetical protein, partial [Agathobaculum sp.]|uniref:hypothetical protein n=1 Tax=Agathobaculum sp. TaxID=2048138 RepID=UPI003AB1798D